MSLQDEAQDDLCRSQDKCGFSKAFQRPKEGVSGIQFGKVSSKQSRPESPDVQFQENNSRGSSSMHADVLLRSKAGKRQEERVQTGAHK
jgi:hypothetical protein